MEKKNKHYLVILILFFFISNSIANENNDFLSLKNNEVNLRLGPSFEYPIKLIYKKVSGSSDYKPNQINYR